MSTLQFMPWCPIDKTYKAGNLIIIPFDRDQSIEGIDALSMCAAKRILAAYKDIQGHPVQKAALIQYGEKKLLDDINDDERDISYELGELICFSGLAGRDYFGTGSNYCNAEYFTLIGQKFRKEPDYVTLYSKRVTGHSLDGGWTLAELAFSMPIHCGGCHELALDENLLAALCSHRAKLEDKEWGRWQNAISSFNLANTDNNLFRDQVEWVLLCSAFEHLLNAKSEATDVAKKFSGVIQPPAPLLVRDAERKSVRWQSNDRHLRYEWMREFYSVRGDFAHGKLKPQQPLTWSLIEHLALAKIIFPLVVRSLLARHGNTLSDAARAQIDIFEKLADKEFLKPPEGQKNSLDTWWNHLLRDQSWEAARRAFEGEA